MAHGLFEAFFVARILQSSDGSGGGGGGSPPPKQRGALFCRFEPPGARGVAVPAPDNLLPFCWPLGVEAVKPSPYLVTCEFCFTLTGGDGQRLHGFCRKTHDTTHRPEAGGARGGGAVERKRFPQVLCLLSQHCWPAFFSKALEVVDQLLAPHAALASLPPDAPAALFMAALPRAVAAAGPAQPPLGAVLRLPLPYSGAPISVDRMRRALAGKGEPLLGLWPDAIELEVPPSLGNGTANAGVSLARLLWFLTPRQAVTLVASLLLERRVILVARDAETASAAVHAANALLYPFRWQHIFLPLLPLALKDYLAAPMPYLAGVQADCLPLLRDLPLEEVVLIDLDRLGSCSPELGGPGDDAALLPHARELEGVFEVVREHIRSPTELDSTPKCTELVQDFFLRLVGGYRQFVRPDEEVTPAALALGLDRPAPSSSSNASSRGGGEENPRAHGFVFDQAAFIASHKRKDRVVAFLQQFRNSQMLEVFVTERLKLASEGYVTEDPFELKVAERNMRASMRLGLGGGGGGAQKGRIGSLLRRAGGMVKQGGGSLVASIQRMGTSQNEELQPAGRALSGPNLSRLSPGPGGGLARHSPGWAGIGAAAAVAHSRASSFSSSRPGSRSSSYSNLHRASAGLAALNGGVEPSLEQLRADMFFGEERDDTSVASDSSLDLPPPVRPAARGSPGPLQKAIGATRSFGSLFQAAPQPPMASPPASSRSPPQQAQQSQQQAGTAAQQQTPGSVAVGESDEAGWLGAVAGAASAAAAANVASAGSPASGSWSPPAAAVGGMAAASPPALQHSPSGQGWATFGDDLSPTPSPFVRQASRGAGGVTSLLDSGSFGPLGAAMSGAAMRQGSGVLPPADATASLERPQQAAVAPLQQQQQARLSPGLPAYLEPVQRPPPPPPPPQQQQQQQQQQQPRLTPALPAYLEPVQRPAPPSAQQQQPATPQQRPKPPALLVERVTTGWGPVATSPGGDTSPATATSPLPAACRHTAHSPLAQGMDTVHRLASLGGAPGRARTSSSSGGGGTPRRGSSGGGPGVGLHVRQDAFADVAAAAVADASERMPLPAHHRRGSSGSGNPFKDPPMAVAQQQQAALARQPTAGGLALRSTSSFGEWAAAWPSDGPLGAGMTAAPGPTRSPAAEPAAVSLSPR